MNQLVGKGSAINVKSLTINNLYSNQYIC